MSGLSAEEREALLWTIECHACSHTPRPGEFGERCRECRAIAEQVWRTTERILADRLAQVTARAERAEARVERVRGLADEFDTVIGFRGAATAVRAALAETADSDSEPYVPPQSHEQGEVAPGGRGESAGLPEALEAADDFVTFDSETGIIRALSTSEQVWPRPDGAGSAGSEETR